MTPFDKTIMFDAPDFRAIVYIDNNGLIVSERQVPLRVFMHKKLTLDKLREWFVVNHPDFTETDVTGC
jgi:hypothetical protein